MEYKYKLDEFHRLLLSSGVANEKNIRGCTAHELRTFEESLKYSLPQSYSEFLRSFGHQAGLYMRDSEFYFDRLEAIQKSFTSLIARKSEIGIGKTVKLIHPFMSHDGYEVAFFDVTDKALDPLVFLCIDGVVSSTELSFSDWLLYTLAELIRARSFLARGAVTD